LLATAPARHYDELELELEDELLLDSLLDELELLTERLELDDELLTELVEELELLTLEVLLEELLTVD
jgi:hypothetical protein